MTYSYWKGKAVPELGIPCELHYHRSVPTLVSHPDNEGVVLLEVVGKEVSQQRVVRCQWSILKPSANRALK